MPNATLVDVREHPILFSRAMVLAIHAGAKSQTRRVLSARAALIDGSAPVRSHWAALDFTTAFVDAGPSPAGNPGPYLKVRCPTYHPGCVHRVYPKVQVGDRLWVKETFVDMRNGYAPRDLGILYAADDPPGTPAGVKGGWKPSIFMPRDCSRITLEVTEVRVQRLKSMSDDDAVAEGVQRCAEFPVTYHVPGVGVPGVKALSARSAFKGLWDSINGERDGASWEENPWVIAYTFRRIDQETARG